MKKRYRKNVGIIVYKNGKVLLCARADKEHDCWQFPQGGIEHNEAVIDAAKRELFEETGIKNIKLIKEMPFSVIYDFPDNYKNPYNANYDGQEQFWVMFEFLGNDNEIKFDIDPKCIEFKKYRWDDIKVAPKEIVEFKKDVYTKVVDFFYPVIERLNNE